MARAAIAPIFEAGVLDKSRRVMRGLVDWWERLTPVVQFHISLGLACLAGVVIISFAVSFLIQRYVFEETREVTAAGVELHFPVVLSDDVFLQPLDDKEWQRLDRIVRAHFDVYDIVQVKFYGLDGRITYSYSPELVNQFSPEGAISDKLRRAIRGEVVMAREELEGKHNITGRDLPDVFEIYVPVRRDGQVSGVAEVYRNVERLMTNLRYVQGLLTGAVVVAALILFFLLRQIYVGSTQRITAQSVALQNALQEIELTYDRTLETLSVALDARDSETEGHSRRVCEYALLVATELGFSRSELDDLSRGALLHDIGKMNLPDSILLKPGPLSAEEWVEMRRHPDLGFRLLAPIGFLSGALPLVCQHHERFDGTGYPAGLRGDQITLCARIFAVADALDAITSDRPYRKARPWSDAREEILSQSGKQFDPAVVEAFASIPLDGWARIAERVVGRKSSTQRVLQVEIN